MRTDIADTELDTRQTIMRAVDNRQTLILTDRKRGACHLCRARFAADARFCGMCGERLSARASLAGTIVDELYLVVDRIAEGAIATTYRARYMSNGRELTLEVLHAELATDERVVERFRRKGRRMLRLRSRHAVATYDYGETARGLHYIATEPLRGQPLADRLAEQPLAWRDGLRIVRDVCSVLADAHGHGIAHGALDLASIFVDGDGAVKVVDFGDDGDAASDLRALGTLACEMLQRDLPADVERVFQRCIAQAREDHIATADQLGAEIDRVLAVRTATPRRACVYPHTSAFELDVPRIVADPSPTPAFARGSDIDVPPPRRGSPALSWLFAFLIGGVGVGTAVAQLV